MRASDIKPGQQYTFERTAGRRLLVTVLPTPPEVRRKGRFLVRFEEGVLRGQVSEQLPRFIVAPASGASILNSTVTRIAPRAITVPSAWPPNVSDPVTWPTRTAALRWHVSAVDMEDGSATIAGRVLEMHQEHTVPLAELEPVGIVAVSNVSSTRPGRRPTAPPSRELPLATERDERSPLQRAADRLEFTPECLRQYQRDFEPRVPWPEISARLRREIRNQGRLRRRGREYLRIRTRRFDVVVPRRPSDERPCVVERLLPLGRANRRS